MGVFDQSPVLRKTGVRGVWNPRKWEAAIKLTGVSWLIAYGRTKGAAIRSLNAKKPGTKKVEQRRNTVHPSKD